MKSVPWKSIPCLCSQLQLSATLLGGQSFRWKKSEDDDEYVGVMANCVWLLKQSETELFYKIIGELPYPESSNTSETGPLKKRKKFLIDNEVRMKVPEPKKNSLKTGLLYETHYYEDLLKSYFRLDVNLEEHYKSWTKAHSHFEAESDKFYAVRMLNQDPVENLFSFICSQNNNISRISALVEKLCTGYGRSICKHNDIEYFAFPDIADLSHEKIDGELRKAGFGYRAKFIQKSAAEILTKGALMWFRSLQDMEYKQAHEQLMTLTGIGPKVADCICLMSLNHLQAIPVDTHVFQIATKNYLPQFAKAKTVTPKIYSEIGDKFRDIYGPLAGWAQTILFCADLRKFKDEKA